MQPSIPCTLEDIAEILYGMLSVYLLVNRTVLSDEVRTRQTRVYGQIVKQRYNLTLSLLYIYQVSEFSEP